MRALVTGGKGFVGHWLSAHLEDLGDEVAVIERRQVSVAQLVERALSRSSTTTERLGPAAAQLAKEIEELLAPLASDGMLSEVIATTALIARRPDEAS